MIKQLSITLTFLLTLGFVLNSCDDKNPSFQNPDPLDTGVNTLDTLLDPSDTAESPGGPGGPGDPGGSDDTADITDTLRLAITGDYDSARDQGSVKEDINPAGYTVELYESETLDNLIDESQVEEVDPVPKEFENGDGVVYPKFENWAIFQNEEEQIEEGQQYYIKVEPFEYGAGTLGLKTSDGGDSTAINVDSGAPWEGVKVELEER
jgi:hypothetical protein